MFVVPGLGRHGGGVGASRREADHQAAGGRGSSKDEMASGETRREYSVHRVLP
jgi:hypothetical protein